MGLLDRHPLEVSHPDTLALITFLYQTYETKAQVQFFAKEAGVDLALVDLDQPTAILWQSVTVAAANQRRLRVLVDRVRLDANSAGGTVLISRLLTEPVEDAPAPVIQPFAAAGPVLTDNTFEAGLLWDDLPFIDRTRVREHLKKMMLGQASRRALLVTGDRGAGKSYTRQFIYYLSDNGGPAQPSIKPIDLSRHGGAPIDERELASSVATKIVGRDAPTFDPDAKPETIVRLFMSWLTDEVRARNEPMWLVFDGLTTMTATGGALRLVDAMARAAANRDLGPLRVVVLGYEGNAASAGLALSESLAHPTREDVKVFFARAATALQGAAPDDDALEDLVDSFGAIDSVPLDVLGPSALEHVRTVLGTAS
ncbi:MAG: hypothetical protein L0H79_14630 [Intrasporangium sp.]|uniref:hypothetical protein n=1 Tax=Intrasporangium sp. TaxID=1925024 RepID=UPI00264A2406|nr:hypothetical protein [Intrasporangium sp.]MDN5796978.1 hypothetical protein [Intrasporangium sp.]